MMNTLILRITLNPLMHQYSLEGVISINLTGKSGAVSGTQQTLWSQWMAILARSTPRTKPKNS
jgi:hypothetical protein